MTVEVSWFAALCDDDYEFLGVPDPMLQSSWEHCRDIVMQADSPEGKQIAGPLGLEPRVHRQRGAIAGRLRRRGDGRRMIAVRIAEHRNGSHFLSREDGERTAELVLEGGRPELRQDRVRPGVGPEGDAVLRHLAGFMIGATENSWSNFTLARSMSRIFVGKHVDLRLINRVGDTVLPVSTSDAFASASRVTLAPSSRTLPVAAPVTTGASLTPAICTVAVAQLSVPLDSRIA